MKVNSGCASLTRAMSGGQYSVGGRRPGPVAPRAGEDLVGHQHRHVAAHPVALRGDVDQRLGDRVAQGRGEGVELHHVRPGREVGVAASGEDAGGGPQERLGMLLELRLRPARAGTRAARRPGMVGRHVVGDVVEDQREAAGGERGARGGEPVAARRSGRRPRSRARSRASRSRPRRGGRAGRRGWPRRGPGRRARWRARPGCAPRRPSATRRRRAAPRSRPTRRPARRRARSPGARARPPC